MGYETNDGWDSYEQEREHLPSFREAMRYERDPPSEGDKPDDLKTIDHVGDPEKFAPYGTYQGDEGETGAYDCAVVT